MLRQPANDPRDAAVRWRQLVDLIARAGPIADGGTIAEALQVIREDAQRIDEPLRAAAARAIAALPLPFGLLECFVADQLTVSAPILAAASLEPAQWTALLTNADDETRRFVQTIHPELAIGLPPSAPLPPSETEERLIEDAESEPKRDSKHSSIGAMIERIGRHRSTRPAPPAAPSPAQPGGPSVFRWESAANGEINWVDSVPRGAIIGRSIAKSADAGGDKLDPAVARAFAQRAPFRDAELLLAGEGAVGGAWKISGVPAFDPADGRFAGYRGIALKEITVPAASHGLGLSSLPLPLDGDSLRELVHEIKTPLNAIIGFAEIIDGQYLGPAGRNYRARATGIASQARLLLEAIVDLDLAAQSQAAALRGKVSQADLAAATRAALDGLREEAERRGIVFPATRPKGAVVATAEQGFLERLVERLLGALVELAAAGETLQVKVSREVGKARLATSRPVAMPALSEGAGTGDMSVPGLFSLRLVRGLARIAGGELELGPDNVTLAFPAA